MSGEFDLIARFFAPLARDPAALGLGDDAALLRPTPGRDLVLTTDSLVAGVHFREADPPEVVARKALRVNLSDLAAMGARPRGYLLNASWPASLQVDWIKRFTSGLKEDQDLFAFPLLGGDTVSTPGPLSITVTALGEVTVGQELRRAGARVGDGVFFSGTLGDAALGLEVLEGRRGGLDTDAEAALAVRYLQPEPRVTLGLALAEKGLASAALDVSDGLIADLGHICEQSGCGADLQLAALPLSPAARTCLAADPTALETVVAGGDDYELLFTAPDTAEASLAALAERLDLAITRIGVVTAGSDVRLLNPEGAAVTFSRRGWQHR